MNHRIRPNANLQNLEAARPTRVTDSRTKCVSTTLLLAVGAAILLRLPGLFWGLPGADHLWPYQPDESTFFLTMKNFDPSRLNFNPVDFSWPGLMLYAISTLFLLLHVTGIAPLVADMAHYAAHPEHLTRLYLAARLITLAAALGSILIAERLAATLSLPRRLALFAPWLVAIVPVHMINSTVAAPHMLSAALAAMAITSACRPGALEQTRGALLVGVFWGLAVGALYDAWILFFPLSFLVLTTVRGAIGIRRWFLLCVTAVTAFFLVNPYVLLAPSDFLASWNEISGYLTLVRPSMTRFISLISLAIGAPAAILATFGILSALRYLRRNDPGRRAITTVAIWALVYSVMIAWTGTDFLRRILPLVIPCVCLALHALNVLPRRLAIIALIVVTAWPLWVSAAYLPSYTHGDTRTLTRNWVDSNLPEGAAIGVVNWFLGPHLDTARFRCHLLQKDGGFPEPLEYFIGTELEMPQETALRRWPEAHLIAGFRHKPAFAGISLDESGAPEDWFYTHPRVYVLELARRQ
jgi:hypothetical protein